MDKISPNNEELFIEQHFDELYKQNEKFIYYMANKYRNIDDNYEELISLANLGFSKALITYKPEIGTKFISFCSRLISNELLMYLRRTKKHKNVCYLNEQIYFDKEGHIITLEDTLSSFEKIEDDYIHQEELSKLKEAIDMLPKKQRQIVEMSLEGKTQHEISKILNLSQSYVSRLYHNSLKIIKKSMEGIHMKSNDKKAIVSEDNTFYENQTNQKAMQHSKEKLSNALKYLETEDTNLEISCLDLKGKIAQYYFENDMFCIRKECMEIYIEKEDLFDFAKEIMEIAKTM